MFTKAVSLLFCAVVLALSVSSDDTQPKLWALLIAGSNEWYNYRHQADVYHAYQILRRHGIPDSQIVVMHYDDIANNEENPHKGTVINHSHGKDVYHGVPKDYTGEDVTPENFIKVLTGDAAGLKGIGSGKTIQSGPKDHVFVNFVDHGAEGILGFPDGELTVKQLRDAINEMHVNKKYGKLVFYIEACESGSMFRKVLPTNINVYATTASAFNESSYACYYDDKYQTYLGDVYSVKWMENSDAENIEIETLLHQYELVKKETNTSHVREFGDLSISKLQVGQFQGEKAMVKPVKLPEVPYDAVPSLDVPIVVLYKRLSTARSEKEKQEIMNKINQMNSKRAYVDKVVKRIVKELSSHSNDLSQHLLMKRSGLKDVECHHMLVKAFSKNCFNFGKNSYALKYGYVLANICEHGLDTEEAIRVMQKVCHVHSGLKEKFE